MSDKVYSFADAAALRPEDVKPVNLPQGTYVWEIFQLPANPEPTTKGFGEMFRVMLRLVSPIDEFENPEQLQDYISTVGDPTGAVRSVGFYIPTKDDPNGKSTEALAVRNRRAFNDIVQFFSVKCGMGDMPLGEYRVQCLGARVLGTIQWEKDPENQSEYREKLMSSRDFAPIG